VSRAIVTFRAGPDIHVAAGFISQPPILVGRYIVAERHYHQRWMAARAARYATRRGRPA